MPNCGSARFLKVNGGFIILLMLLTVLVGFSPVSAETSDESTSQHDEEGNNTQTPSHNLACHENENISIIKPSGFLFNEWQPSDIRPDMPSGDLVKQVSCWLENHNNFNITVNLSVPYGVRILDPDYVYCWEVNIGFGSAQEMCNYGRWLINGDDNSFFYNLGSHENLTINWIIYTDRANPPMQSGEQLINLSTVITLFGEHNSSCLDCLPVNYSSTHVFGEWWRMNWDGDYTKNYSNCNYDYQIYIRMETPNLACYPALGGLANDEGYFTNKYRDCNNRPMYQSYTPPGWGMQQWISTCHPQIDQNWQELFMSSNLDRAKMLANENGPQGDDYVHWGFNWKPWINDINEINDDFWQGMQCPAVPVNFEYLPYYEGNSLSPNLWKVEFITHKYDFSNASWNELTIHNRSFNLSELPSYDPSNMTYSLNFSHYYTQADLIVVEIVAYSNQTEFTSTIIGECLTYSGVNNMEEIIEQAKFTMGDSGNSIERLVNKFAFYFGVSVPILVLISLTVVSTTGFLIKKTTRKYDFQLFFLVGLVIPPMTWIGLFAILGEPCIIWCGDSDWPLYEICFSNILLAILIAVISWGNRQPPIEGKRRNDRSFAKGFFIGTILAVIMVGFIVEIYY